MCAVFTRLLEFIVTATVDRLIVMTGIGLDVLHTSEPQNDPASGKGRLQGVDEES